MALRPVSQHHGLFHRHPTLLRDGQKLAGRLERQAKKGPLDLLFRSGLQAQKLIRIEAQGNVRAFGHLDQGVEQPILLRSEPGEAVDPNLRPAKQPAAEKCLGRLS